MQLTADLYFGRPEVNVAKGAVLKRKLQNLWISLDLRRIQAWQKSRKRGGENFFHGEWVTLKFQDILALVS